MNPVVRERRLLLWCVILAVLQCLAMPVFSQEAYYWCYAQHPALSYFDHPPMVAWLIWIGTHLLGDSAAGIRLGTCACTLGTTWVGLLWLRRLGCDPWIRAGWLVCTFAMPMLMCAHFLATPDPPLVFFWTLTMYALWRARDGGIGWWLMAGFAAGCALLSKYAAAFLAVGGALVLAFDPLMRRQLRRPGVYVAVLVSALTFLPVVWWNVANDFESFRFQTEGRWVHARLGLRWFGQFVASQFGLLHPLITTALPFALVWMLKRALAGDRRSLWMLAFALPMPLFFIANSLFIQVKVNWLLPTFLPLAAGALSWWHETGRRDSWPRATRIATRVLVFSALLFGIGAPLVRVVPQSSGSSWHGWDHIAERAEAWEERLDARDGVHGNVFFCASGYRDAAQLWLHLRRHDQRMPEDHELEFVLAQQVFGEPALEFDYWEPASAHVGEDAIYVLLRPDRRPRELEKLARHFGSAERVERIELKLLGMTLAIADIYEARDYLGPRVAR